MRYVNFCSGSKGNCTLIESAQARLIIDCGGTKQHLSQSLHNWGVDLSSVDALLITHDHGDHIGQLKLFQEVPVCYSPVELKLRSEVITPMPYQTFWIKDIEVMPLVLSHDSGMTYGYTFKTQDCFLVYITDTGYLKTADYRHIQNADIYLFESNHDVDLLMNTNRPHMTKARILSDTGHLSNEDSAEILSHVVGPNTKEIVLAHLSEQANTEVLALSVLQEALIDRDDLDPMLKLLCAKQSQSLSGGQMYEKQFNQSLDLGLARLE